MNYDCALYMRRIDMELAGCLIHSNGVTYYHETWMWNNNVFRQAFKKMVITENNSQLNNALCISERIEHANIHPSK